MSIRLRVALVFAIALAVAFSLGSWLLVGQLKSVMLGSVDAGLAAKLTQARKLVTSAKPGASVPSSLAGLAPGDYVAQLVDRAGLVRASSEDAGSAPLLNAAQRRTAASHDLTVTATIDGESERLTGGPVQGLPGWVAVVGTSLESYDATVAAVVARLAIGGAILVIVSGLGAYGLAAAALAPVERLRRRAAALSESDPSPQLPVPGTKDEISALAGTMNDLLGRLHEALARQRALVADASHELRTPLAVLSAELELAAKPGRDRAELVTAVANASGEAVRLSRLTNDLLMLATSDEGRLAPRLSPADLSRLLAGAVGQANQRRTGSQATCVAQVPAGLTGNVDADQIRRAVDNLVENALRFAPAGTQVVVRARAEGRLIVIEVTDDGPGFPVSYLSRAFERFSRPDTGRARAEGGAGLGLSIVQAIARAHGGRATAGNLPAGGAIVRIELPGAAGGRDASPGRTGA